MLTICTQLELTSMNVFGSLDPFTLPYLMDETPPVVECSTALMVQVWVSQNVMLPSSFPVASSRVPSSAARQVTLSPSSDQMGFALECSGTVMVMEKHHISFGPRLSLQ